MMRVSSGMRTVALIVLVGCSGSSSTVESPAVEPDIVVETSRALAYQVVSTHDRDGTETTERGTIFVERVGDRLVVHGMPLGMIPEEHARRWWFPVPADGSEWNVPGMGRTSNVIRPDLNVRDRFETEPLADAVRIRTHRVASFAPLGSIRCEIDGELEPSEHRYRSLTASCTTELDTSGTDVLSRDIQLRGSDRWEATFDARASLQRRRVLESYAEIRREARREYDAYREAHPPEARIRAVLRERLPVFHSVANRALVWSIALDDDDYEDMRSMLGASHQMGAPLADEVEGVIRARLDRNHVRRLVSRWPLESFRSELESWAAGPDPELRERAREALAQLAVRPSDLREMSADQRMLHATRLMLGGDPVEMTGTLIELLRSEPESRVLVQWLEALTLQVHGSDVDAWTRFWETHQHQTRREWLLEAARSDTALIRHAAYRQLRTMPPSDDALPLLRAGVADPIQLVRDEAVTTLLAWGDLTVLDHALDAMASYQLDRRRAGLAMVAWVGDHDLGYEPDGDEAERVAALARWREWAEREQ